MLPEPETEALREFLAGWSERVSSALARVEVLRAARRGGTEETYQRAENVVNRVGLIGMDGAVLDAASRLQPPELRSLDAIHLATALVLGEGLGGLVSYDERLARAAASHGIGTLSPGAEG